jgi:hypothetical protein
MSGEESITLRGVNNLPIGKLTVGPTEVKITFSAVRDGHGDVSFPKGAVKRAEVSRVGRISANSYALRIFLDMETCRTVSERLTGLLVEPKPNLVIGLPTFARITGEYVEFMIDPVDVFGLDQRGPSRSRAVVDALTRK